MEAPIKTRYDKAGPQVAEALRRRHFEAHYASTAQEALDLALTLIPKDRTVSWGGTVTAAQIGLMDRLHQGDYQLIDRDTGKTPAEKQELMRQALTCGTFIMSSNAISTDGQLVNLDGNANRVAALCFGPESVLVIAGMNKVMGDLDSAIARARQVAAPANAQRFDIKTPCAVTGSCGDCTSPDCICCQMVITRGLSSRRTHQGHSGGPGPGLLRQKRDFLEHHCFSPGIRPQRRPGRRRHPASGGASGHSHGNGIRSGGRRPERGRCEPHFPGQGQTSG